MEFFKNEILQFKTGCLGKESGITRTEYLIAKQILKSTFFTHISGVVVHGFPMEKNSLSL